MSGRLAVLNAGSSSIKFALYAAGGPLELAYRGQVEQIGAAPHLQVQGASGEPAIDRSWPADGFNHQTATAAILAAARELTGDAPVIGVGHRVVHGGVRYAAPVRVDAETLAALEALTPFAPLHQPHNIAPIRAIAEAAPHIPQVACFDTAFHRSQAELAQAFALPRRFAETGIRRYGFHGLSYEYVAERLCDVAPRLAGGRVVIAHLGNGASLCAIEAGRSVATTMGFSTLDGLMMGTRCGAIDPGVLIHLMEVHGMDARDIEDLLYRRSGLFGVSGVSSDMRALRASHDPAAAEAIALFVYRIRREIGSLVAALGGLDGLVFTAGIGEHDATTRAEIAAGCRWLGLELDLERNQTRAGRISADGSRVEAWVIPTNEELMVARHTLAILDMTTA